MNQPASAYFMEERHEPTEAHTLSVLVQNEPGVLARVIGLFSGRGYNIESLTVSETESQKHLSRITIVTRGTPQVLIDGVMVNGTADEVSRFGGLLRLVQSGYLYSYALWMMIGLAVLLGWFLAHLRN